MQEVELSVLFSSHDRLGLFRRALYSLAYDPPGVPFEVVVADDGSTDDIPGLLREFNSCFPWTFVSCDPGAFEKATGVRRYFNNPSWTNNVAFKHSRGRLVALMGNEVIAAKGAVKALLEEGERLFPRHKDNWLLFSTTYDLDQASLDRLDEWGSDLDRRQVERAKCFPLQSQEYRSDVTNYLSLSPRTLWEGVGGYDERYVGGISADDSDFVRRARARGCHTAVVSAAVSLHQYHRGKSRYYDPPPEVITREDWDRGVDHNHAIYHAWAGGHANPQGWAWGECGVAGVRRNFK